MRPTDSFTQSFPHWFTFAWFRPDLEALLTIPGGPIPGSLKGPRDGQKSPPPPWGMGGFRLEERPGPAPTSLDGVQPHAAEAAPVQELTAVVGSEGPPPAALRPRFIFRLATPPPLLG